MLQCIKINSNCNPRRNSVILVFCPLSGVGSSSEFKVSIVYSVDKYLSPVVSYLVLYRDPMPGASPTEGSGGGGS